MSIFDSEVIKEYLEDCRFLNQAVVDDGVGGYKSVWTLGAHFDAVITENSTTETIVAGIQNKTTFYGVKTERRVPLEYHTVFMRMSDRKTFRIRTPDGLKSPSFSPMDIKQLDAEEYTPPEEITPEKEEP